MANYKAYKPVVCGKTTGATGLAIGKLIQVTITPNTSDVKLYGDDSIAERVKSFTDATVALNVTTVPKAVAALLFGATSTDASTTEGSETDSSLTYGELKNDYVKFGFISVEKVNNVDNYKVTWMPKVMFSLPTETYDTKGESVTFGTPSLSGTAEIDDTSKTWKEEYFYTTADEAVTKLNTLASIS